MSQAEETEVSCQLADLETRSEQPIQEDRMMSEHDYVYAIAPAKELRQLKTALFTEEAKEIFLKHGCRLVEHPDKCIVFFPEGTTRAEIFPRTMSTHYQITLPDGYQIREVHDRHREISILLYPPE